MNRVDCVIFVTVRLASKRLPEKALLKIDDQPMIKTLVDRLKTSNKIKKVIVCTTTNKSDDKLTDYLKDNNIEVFRGDNEDILNRLYQAAKKYDVKQFVVVEGDDFFCDLSLIEETCDKISNSEYEFLLWESLPFGVSPLGIKTNKLQKLIEQKTIKDTETGWGKIIAESKLFKVGKLQPSNRNLMRPEIRLTIDYPEDLELVRIVYKKIPTSFTLMDIIRVFEKNPELIKINESAKLRYAKNFENEYTASKLKEKK